MFSMERGSRKCNPRFRAIAEERGFWSESLLAELRRRGRVRGLDGVPAEVQRQFPTAHDLSPEVHVRMQAAFQQHSHSAVSKTINLPTSATPSDIADAYQLAYELGCKGVTVLSRSQSLRAGLDVWRDQCGLDGRGLGGSAVSRVRRAPRCVCWMPDSADVAVGQPVADARRCAGAASGAARATQPSLW